MAKIQHTVSGWEFPTTPGPLVKICGLTRPGNALDCVRAGAHMIGLVFFEKSPRHLSVSQAREITSTLPPHVLPCGVFVDAGYDTIMDTAQRGGIRAAQLHGNEPPGLATQLSRQGLVVIKAFFAARAPLLSTAATYPDADFCLAEYGKGVLPGGNAETWNYGLAADVGGHTALMLAGGLTPDNVGEAIAQARPAAVDASSGVESAPGVKDIEKMKAFISAVASAGRTVQGRS